MFRSICGLNRVATLALRASKASHPGKPPVIATPSNLSNRTFTSSVMTTSATATDPPPVEAISISSDDETNSAPKKRKTRVQQTSIEEYMLSKNYLYVTDLVGPTWCEYSYQYNIMGVASLPISERPETITLPSGKEIRPNAEMMQKRENIKKTGNQIHAKLEREVHPEKITVQTQSGEDRWALRLLKLIVGLRSLIDRGCVRELPVFGWAEHYLVTGIIDEIEKRPLLKKRQAEAAVIYDAQKEGQTGDGQSKLPFAESASTSSNVKSPSAKKTWSSQEEWKAHQRKVEGTKKTAARSKAKTKSPKKAKAGAGDALSDGKQQGLQSFFGSSKPSDIQADVSAPAEEPPDTATAVAALQGFFLSDTKTRTFDSLPRISEQRGARLQTMMYKRMLDGLCQGAVERAVAAQKEAAAKDSVTSADDQQKLPTLINHMAIGIRGDPDATALDFASVFAKLDLSPDQALSQAFRDDAQELLDELDVSHLPAEVARVIEAATADADVRKVCLSDLVHVVDEHLIELLVKAQRECSVPKSEATDEQLKQHIFRHHWHDASAIQTDLSLIYRLQHKKKAKGKGRARGRTGVKESTLDIESLPEIQAVIQKSLEGQAELGPSTQEEDGKGFEIISLSSSPPRRRSRRLAGKEDPATPTQTPLPTIDARTPSLSLSPPTPAPAPQIIGQVTFPSLPLHLTSHLRSILDFWHGKRDPIGVGENETWKCRGCEWFEGCEWRHDRGEEKRLWAAQRRSERLVKETTQDEERPAQWTPIEYEKREDDEGQDDYEESLWAHFDSDEHLALPSSQVQPQQHSADHTTSASSLNAEEQDWVEMQADRAADRDD